MKKHYETHVEDTDKLISVAGPVLDYKSWYEQYRKLMEEQAQRKYGLYTPTSEGDDDDFPSISGITTRYSALGLTNEQMAENPVWKDLTGNGHDLQMKNFLWGGMSGVGGYTQNFNQYFVGFDESNKTVSDSSMKLVLLESDSQKVIYDRNSYQIGHTYNFYIKVTGIEGRMLNVNAGTLGGRIMSITEDGIYSINVTVSDSWGQNRLYLIFPSSSSSNTVTIEQLPLYPGFILGDGVDDFTVTENNLDLEDTYTIYTPLILLKYGGVVCGKNSDKDFSLNTVISSKSIGFDSANAWSGSIPVDLFEFVLVACKRSPQTMYVKDLVTGKSNQNKSKEFVPNPRKYFVWRNVGGSWCQVAIAGQIICNGYYSTDEDDEKVLDWYKKQYPWLFPDQAWTVVGKTNEDEDRTTIANITGNGNDLVLSNFGFAEGSGYGLYKTPFELYPSVQHSSKYSLSFSKFTLGDHNLIITPKQNDLSYDIKVKVTGLKDGVKFKWGWIGTTGYIDITTDGIHMLNKPASQIRQLLVEFAEDFDPDHVVTIEQIPEYEGYLVTDGVDDEVRSAAFTLNEDWTIVGDWELLSNVQINCGIVKAQNVYLYNTANGLLISINNPRSLQSFGTKSLHAICSDGRLYDRNWVEYEYTADQNFAIVESSLNIGFNLNNYTQMAFKNLGIYNNQLLSKDDCIKAYNYLQTLKSK